MTISKYIEQAMKNSSWIRRMFEAGNELAKVHGRENVFDFTLGNPSEPPPALFFETLRNTVAERNPAAHRYMSNAGYPETRDLIAKSASDGLSFEISLENVIMTVGAAGGLNITLKSILDPGSEVLCLTPYFPEYRFYIENHGGKFINIPTDANFAPIPEVIAGALSKNTKAIIINTPNNPTGVIYSAEILRNINEILQSFKKRTGNTVYVISDEPYRKILYDGKTAPKTLDIFDDVIFCTSHSKDLGLPGERIGYAIISPRTQNARELFDAMVFCNRTLGYVNAPAVMQRVVGKLQNESVNIASYEEKRNIFCDGLCKSGYEVVKPDGAFYLFPKAPGGDDVEFIQTLMKERILAVPGQGFGLGGYFRISYCVEKDTILRSLEGFDRAINSFKQ
ncbi:pyridoxal phosphate-dependent aminotransferase [Myxococcota bacterium]|nr:pyridoxal phosphate-dependent aminotransferase [Myxococcota bacterium]MBU1380770.1 pyridoxal phosphate-dependent aminotransferase [Myxococcota bacterium]MBU1498904.1 pyridoxal phosphate-dependent aminotransferase [Myxococcota bacterium]